MGEFFMKTSDPGLSAVNFYKLTVMKLKVCGMKYESNIMELSKLNLALWVSFFINHQSVSLKNNIPDLPKSISKIGVFVDADISYILDSVKSNKLDGVQLHGNEKVDFIKKLKVKCQEQKLSLKYIKVFAVDDSFNFNQTEPYISVCDYFYLIPKAPCQVEMAIRLIGKN